MRYTKETIEAMLEAKQGKNLQEFNSLEDALAYLGMGNKYIENPKTKGSGIICCIPQKGKCPIGCEDCFYNNGRSYLEPLHENTPNIPPMELVQKRIVRVNDGCDSLTDFEKVREATKDFPLKFYNTSQILGLHKLDAPFVLTVNPGPSTDVGFYQLDMEQMAKLMFVRFRTNLWNLDLAIECIKFYESYNIPIVLTWMAYHSIEKIPFKHLQDYVLRKRTLNAYWAIRGEVWLKVMQQFLSHALVHNCDNELIGGGCKRCGNCLREFWRVKTEMESD